MSRKIRKIILHCSASDVPNQTAALIDKWHRQRGFLSPSGKHIGYHWFIGPNGLIEKGRPEEEVGAHCEGQNMASVGVCLAGLTRFNDSQFSSLRKLLTEIKGRYPQATIHGHNEFPSAKAQGKTCPVYSIAELTTIGSDLNSKVNSQMTERSERWTFKKFIDLLAKIFQR